MQIKVLCSLDIKMLQKVWKIPEFIASAVKTKKEIICLQEYRFVHLDIDMNYRTYVKWDLLTRSTWNNSTNTATEDIGIIVNTRVYNAISSIDII